MKRIRPDDARTVSYDLPDEIWLLIFRKSRKCRFICFTSYDNAMADGAIFGLASVSLQWDYLVGQYVRKYMAYDKGSLNRVLLRFPETETLYLNCIGHRGWCDRPYPSLITHTTLCSLTRLTELHVPRDLELTDGTFLQMVTRLKRLSLKGDNSITSQSLGQATQLTSLSLDDTPLQGEFFSKLTNLVTLELRHATNQYYYDQLATLTKLSNLAITGNGRDIAGDSLTLLTNLDTLNLCNYNGVHTIPFTRLPLLTALNISGYCRITDSQLCSLTHLRRLWLAGNPYVKKNDLTGLTNLEYLSLYETNVKYTVLTRLTNLKQLSLCQPRKSNNGPVNLQSLVKLEWLEIVDTNLLHQIFPNDTCPYFLSALKELVCGSDKDVKSIPRVIDLLEKRGVRVSMTVGYSKWRYNSEKWLDVK